MTDAIIILALVLAFVGVFVCGYYVGRHADRRRRALWAKFRL